MQGGYRWDTRESNDLRPYSHHPYAYSLSNPVNYTDPTGKCVPGLDVGCEFIGWNRVVRFDLNWDDAIEYAQMVDQTVKDAIVGPVELLYNAATDAETQATIALDAQQLWAYPATSAGIIGKTAIAPFTDIYNGIVCGDSVQLGRGLTGYALILATARFTRGRVALPETTLDILQSLAQQADQIPIPAGTRAAVAGTLKHSEFARLVRALNRPDLTTVVYFRMVSLFQSLRSDRDKF